MRRTNYPEMTPGRFKLGTFEKIDQVKDGWRETRADFIRNAVANEIAKRQAPAPKMPELPKHVSTPRARPARPAPAHSIAKSKARRAAVAKKQKGK